MSVSSDVPPKSAVDADDRYRAPALDKGLDILELLSEQPGGLTRAEIVKAMGRSPGEVYRMLERLVVRGYVGRSMEGDRYALTMRLFALAHRHPPLRRLVAPAQPLMDEFARNVRQSCHLVAPDRNAALVVAQASCPANWEFGIRVGAPIDLIASGSGQILLAFAEPAALAEHLARWQATPLLQAYEALVPRLRHYREEGYRIGDSQQVRGISDISVPVLSPDGHAIAALTCPFIDRLDTPQSKIEDVLEMLRDVALKLSL